jgi:polar amino acid transport system substrate-binding protein
MHDTLIPSRALVALGAGSLVLTGCGSSVAPGSGASADLRAKLPPAIRSAGVLKIGSELNYAPVDFKDPTGAPAGLDPDLAAALAKTLGLRVQFVDMPFAKLIPAVQSKDVDLAMSAVIDTQERQNGLGPNGHQTTAGVDFVDYFMTGTSILVKSGNPQGITTLDSLCGRTVAVQTGTIQDELATRQVAACDKLHKSLQIHRRDNDADALAEVSAGTAVADLNDYPVAVYNTTSNPHGNDFQLATGGQLGTSPYGITVNHDNSALRDVLAKALNQMIENGDYDKLLDKWHIHAGAVTSAVVNGGL